MLWYTKPPSVWCFCSLHTWGNYCS